MPSWEQAEATIFELIEQIAKSSVPDAIKALAILQLAEARAWLKNPNQPHGSSSAKTD